MKFGLSQKDLRIIQNVVREFPAIKKIKLFGSRAMGTQKKGSDIDLAVYGKIPHSTLTQLKIKLEEDCPLPYRFDIILWNEITNTGLKKHIRKWGVDFFS